MILGATNFLYAGLSRWIVLPLLLVCLGLPVAMEAATKVNSAVSLSPAQVPAGETAVYQLQVVNAQPDQLPEFPTIEGLEISFAGQQTSTNTRIFNGRMERIATLIYQWKIVPQKEGVFLIPPLEFKVKGEDQKTKAVQLSVSKGIDYSQYAFIQLDLPKKEFYEGEPFSFSIDLYEQNARVEKAPDLVSDGFIVQRISDNLRQGRKVVGNATYNVWSLDYIGRSVRHGDLRLGPVDWAAGLIFRQQSRSRSVFDSFFNDINTQRRDVVLKAEGETLTILPLPEEGRPDSSNGAIGRYTMSVDASPKNLTAGDPLTVIITITGEGPLDAVPMPPIDHWVGFKTYPPNAKTESNDKTGLRGTRIFEQVIIPQSSDLKALPPLDFSYFDPGDKVYHTLNQPATPIEVKANPNAPSMPTQTLANSGEEGLPKPKPKDVVPIKPFLGEVVSFHKPWMLQSRAYGFQIIPLLILGIAYGVHQVRERSGKDVRGKRRRQVDQFVRKQLPVLESLAQKNDSDAFFELMFRLLQERLGQCLHLPAASITESVLDGNHRQWECDRAYIDRLHQLFQACNQARYAPVESSEQLAEYATKCRDILMRLK